MSEPKVKTSSSITPLEFFSKLPSTGEKAPLPKGSHAYFSACDCSSDCKCDCDCDDCSQDHHGD